MNHLRLTIQLLDLLTKEEVEQGNVSITYDIGISTSVTLGSGMVDKIMERSPYRDHIIGFKRGFYCIDLVLDEEGQKKWNAAYREAAEWIAKYGND